MSDGGDQAGDPATEADRVSGLSQLAERAKQHAAQVRRDLELLDYPRRLWIAPRRGPGDEAIYDVVIVGAGQGGLAVAFGLAREKVANVLVIDENPLDRAGPWLNYARMRTLRTPKHVTGPDLGIPSLTPRAWYEAQHGVGSWETLGLIPKETWAAYLAWYRCTLDIPVQPETRVGTLRWNAQLAAWEVPCTSTRAPANTGSPDTTLLARRVVLATGIDGLWAVAGARDGERQPPAPSLCAHARAD